MSWVGAPGDPGPCGIPWCCWARMLKECCGDCKSHGRYTMGMLVGVMDSGQWKPGVALLDHEVKHHDGTTVRVVDVALPSEQGYGWVVDRKYVTDIRGPKEPP